MVRMGSKKGGYWRITQVGLRHVFQKIPSVRSSITSKVISYVTEVVDPLTYNEIDGIWDFVGECTCPRDWWASG